MDRALNHLSFEFFPPKTPQALHNLLHKTAGLLPFHPEFFSVTFGAGGSTQDFTLQTVQQLQERFPTPVSPHLTAVGMNDLQIANLLQLYTELNIQQLVILRGDIPSGMVSLGKYAYACDLVNFVRNTTLNRFNLAVAAYPEFHPEATSPLKDVEFLKKKIDCGANFAITQYFFNPESYCRFVDLCCDHGIKAPIVPGIMPIANFSQLSRFSERCGADIPRWLSKRLAAYRDDAESLCEFGYEIVTDLCEKLINYGAPGLHFYTLNQPEHSIRILNALCKTKISIGSTVI